MAQVRAELSGLYKSINQSFYFKEVYYAWI